VKATPKNEKTYNWLENIFEKYLKIILLSQRAQTKGLPNARFCLHKIMEKIKLLGQKLDPWVPNIEG
jgi:hypothetical protein